MPNNEAVHREWRRLVVLHEVKGVKVHDARLVASMRIHSIRHIVTFNEADFRRYPDIVAVTSNAFLRMKGNNFMATTRSDLQVEGEPASEQLIRERR